MQNLKLHVRKFISCDAQFKNYAPKHVNFEHVRDLEKKELWLARSLTYFDMWMGHCQSAGLLVQNHPEINRGAVQGNLEGYPVMQHMHSTQREVKLPLSSLP